MVAAGTLDHVDDLARVLRQVHRVLKPEAPLVISTSHPAYGLAGPTGAAQRYGSRVRSIGDWYMALYRSNFRIDSLQELFDTREPTGSVPCTLLIRARKLGV